MNFPYPWVPNRYKFNLGGVNAQVQTPGGWVKILNKGMLPILNGLTAYYLTLFEKGIREPHWHPNASELNYCVSGNVRITLQIPGGPLQTMDLSPGCISMLPRGYLHHIENTGSGEASLVVFFNHESPDDIGLSGASGAFPNEILSTLFGVNLDYFDKFPKYQKDSMIVAGGG
jgi:oxalate decarboxylase